MNIELQPLAEELKGLAEKSRNLSKDEFITQYNAGLNEQNLSRRETAQKVAAFMKRILNITPEQFYDTYVKSTSEVAPQTEQVTATPIGITENVRESGIYQAFMEKSPAELQKAVNDWTKRLDVDLTGFDEITKSSVIAHNKFVLSAAKAALQDKSPTEPVKGEQTGMLGVPGKYVEQKRPWIPGQMEFGSYTKYVEAMDRKYSLEELKRLCRERGVSAPGDKKTLVRRLF